MVTAYNTRTRVFQDTPDAPDSGDDTTDHLTEGD